MQRASRPPPCMPMVKMGRRVRVGSHATPSCAGRISIGLGHSGIGVDGTEVTTGIVGRRHAAPPPRGKHAPCTPGEALSELDEAVGKGQADRLVEILADNAAVVLNPERRAIQVWSTCQEGELGAHLPLPSALFDALLLAQDQDALE